jgi:uncharacterized membrane protein YozB (DUF420 family)
LLIACGVLLALHLYISGHMTVPVLYSDEMGYFANARFLARVGAVPQLPTPFCHFGYSLLLVPIYWLAPTPESVHRAAIVLNAFLSVLHFLVLYALARSLFDLGKREAGLAALVTSLYPAFLLQSSLVWTETLFPLLFTAWVGLATLADRRATRGGVLGFVGVGAFMYATHPRGLALVPITLAFLAWLRFRRRIGSGAFFAGVALQAAAFVFTEVVNRRLHEAMWSWNTESVATRSMDMLTALRSVVLGSQLLLTIAGQVWYLLCASIGLLVPGSVLLVAMVCRAKREQGGRAIGQPSAPAAVALLGGLGILLLSTLHLSRGERLDQLVYGRYNEAFMGVYLLAGITWLLRARRGRDILRPLAVAGLAIAALTALLLMVRGDALAGTLDMPFTVFGVLEFEPAFTADPFASDRRGIFRCDVIAAGALAAIVTFGLVAVRSRRWAVALLGCFFVFAAIDIEPRTLRPVDRWAKQLLTLHHVVRDTGVGGDIAYDRSNIDWFGLNGYQFYLPDHQFRLFDGAAEQPPAALVIASKQWPQAAAWNARPLAAEPLLDQALWLIPHSGASPGGGRL